MSKYCYSVGNPSPPFKHLLLRQDNTPPKPLRKQALGCQYQIFSEVSHCRCTEFEATVMTAECTAFLYEHIKSSLIFLLTYFDEAFSQLISLFKNVFLLRQILRIITQEGGSLLVGFNGKIDWQRLDPVTFWDVSQIILASNRSQSDMPNVSCVYRSPR